MLLCICCPNNANGKSTNTHKREKGMVRRIDRNRLAKESSTMLAESYWSIKSSGYDLQGNRMNGEIRTGPYVFLSGRKSKTPTSSPNRVRKTGV